MRVRVKPGLVVEHCWVLRLFRVKKWSASASVGPRNCPHHHKFWHDLSAEGSHRRPASRFPNMSCGQVHLSTGGRLISKYPTRSKFLFPNFPIWDVAKSICMQTILKIHQGSPMQKRFKRNLVKLYFSCLTASVMVLFWKRNGAPREVWQNGKLLQQKAFGLTSMHCWSLVIGMDCCLWLGRCVPVCPAQKGGWSCKHKTAGTNLTRLVHTVYL